MFRKIARAQKENIQVFHINFKVQQNQNKTTLLLGSQNSVLSVSSEETGTQYKLHPGME